MFNVYLIHKIVLYVKDKETIRIILEHGGYREYMNKNEGIYDDIIYRYIFELSIYDKELFELSDEKKKLSYIELMKISRGIERGIIYKKMKIKTIKSMYRLRERIQTRYFPYESLLLVVFKDIIEEIRYYAIMYQMKELEDWLKKNGIIDEKTTLMILKEEKRTREYMEWQGSRSWY